MSAIEYRQLGADRLDDIKGLWEQLNVLHAKVSPHFAERFRAFTFEKRKQSLLEDAEKEELCVLLARDTTEVRDVGYCVSSFRGSGLSEIESLFLEESHRGRGIGEALMERAMAWLEERGAKDVIISVVTGNENVLNFYERHGFEPYCTILRRTGDK